MGTFSCPLRLTSPDKARTLDLDALVDTGAFYTQAPASLLDELGVERTRSITLEFADGRTGQYDVGRAWASVNGKQEITMVVFANEKSPALLGAYTLAGLNLAVDPGSERLLTIKTRPM